MVIFKRALLLWLAFAAVALGNAGDCYWFLEADPETIAPGTIKVEFASGHTVNYGAGDYLPVGCNVVAYYIVPETISLPKGLYAHSPSCATAVHPTSFLIYQTGQPANSAALGTSSLTCAVCGTSCTAVPPCGGFGQKPCPGSHPNGSGDDDNDGIRNDCDPDEVGCLDSDADGCCDVCDDGSFGGCAANDDDGDHDDDGIRDECDTDLQACPDYDEDGCCDYCGGDCGPPCDEEEECCPGEPGYPACEDCTPENPEYPDCMPCEDNPEHPDYPECEDECEGPECDPCPKLDTIIGLLQQLLNKEYTVEFPEMSPTGQDPEFDVSGQPPMVPVEVNGYLPPFPSELWAVGSEGEGWHLYVPIPGRSPYEIALSGRVADWGLGPLLQAAVEAFQSSFRTLALVMFTWQMGKVAYRFIVDL